MSMQLKNRIREAMEHKGMKPAQLAAKTKKTPGAVSQWLDGTTKSLKADTAALIEAATGYRASWLVTGKGPKLLSDAATPTPIEGEPAAFMHLTPALCTETLGKHIASADALARSQVAPLLVNLVESPERAKELGERLQATLEMSPSYKSGNIAPPVVPKVPQMNLEEALERVASEVRDLLSGQKKSAMATLSEFIEGGCTATRAALNLALLRDGGDQRRDSITPTADRVIRAELSTETKDFTQEKSHIDARNNN